VVLLPFYPLVAQHADDYDAYCTHTLFDDVGDGYNTYENACRV
jgi:hypothetical protein